MAYNREWDKGKQPDYSDYSSWQAAPQANRAREDDYYGDNKRRKFNDGVRAPCSFACSSGLPLRWRRIQQKRLVPSDPSPHVIFLGLDTDFTESDMQAYLTSNGCSIESVTIIRDRTTGISKGFGFAQFTSTEHARAFVDPCFPFIQIPPPASHGATATTAFYRALEAGSSVPPNGRRVKIDYSQSAAPGERRKPNGPTNDGTRDIGNTQAAVLLFRGLDPLSGPQAIAQAMKTSSGLGKEGAKGMRRIILIKDKVATTSWGFAFVEFLDVESASAVLAATMSHQLHPNGFRISDKPVAASFAHPYSFQPVPDHSLRDDATMASSVALGGTEGMWVRYWDESSTAATLEFKVEEPVNTSTPAPVVKEKKEKKKKGSHISGPNTSQVPVEASALPVSDKPVTLNFKSGFTMGKIGGVGAAKKAPLSSAFSMDDGAEDDADATAETSTAEDPKVAAAKKVAPLIASKKTVNNITKWNHVQEVLHHDVPQEIPAAQPYVRSQRVQAETSAPPAATPAPAPAVAVKEAVLPVEVEFEFSDTTAMTCLLCARQFKALDKLKRHNKESDLHKKNFKDANLRDIAREKVHAAKAKAEAQQEAQQPKYRDRASERRVMHNQPDIPLPIPADRSVTKLKHSEGPPPPSPPPPPTLNPGQDEKNIGNKLLKMMGWKEGQGLGTEGDGRVDPIQTAIYAAGAGLGASKAKDITKFANDYAGYVNLAKDSARERYGS
ncbi:uncharacterized protein BXZ73DRAFT_91386 [Epithele typhae]|uniref:uncharacterized protein n=1 Tax=Epithele typhae TaxID=378194 RepID=UPI002007F4BD|nr:uncharacterized protein BXZ73DRAFT_91386 [Epithele typhae]KAH9923996.1 hypothetical protein BXZ73DRAFT_91386 [Epithele typhae]